MKVESDLIFDVGMHKGEDAAFYLRKGFRVVGVEANPVLVEKNKKRFRRQIASGQLIIVNKGIAAQPGLLPFYVNHRLSEWSSFDKAAGTRNDTDYHTIDVPCVTTASLFQQYGVPYYLKVDIEGFDRFSLLDISGEGAKPRYVSCEAVAIDWLDILKAKGYSKFKLINQGNDYTPLDLRQENAPLFAAKMIVKNGVKMRLQRFFPVKHRYGSSGPFGEETKGAWLGYREISELYAAFYQYELNRPVNAVSWFDFHATF